MLISELNPYHRGYLAEQLVQYQLRRRGFEVFLPMAPTSGTDLLILLGSRALRCEVKGTSASNKEVCVQRTLARKSVGVPMSKVGYEPGQVDFFFLVDIPDENVFVVPASVMGVSPRKITLTDRSVMWQYKDRYDMLA